MSCFSVDVVVLESRIEGLKECIEMKRDGIEVMGAGMFYTVPQLEAMLSRAEEELALFTGGE